MRFFRNRREFCAAMVPVLLAMWLGGCASEAVDEENVILVEREEAPVNYSLTVASLGDVVKTQKVKCVYEQTNEEDISFAVSGKRVSQVFVEEGDSVITGQVLAELGSGNLSTRITDLEYRIARNKLLLEQLEDSEARSIERIRIEQDSKEAQETAIAQLKKSNDYTREDYRDSIELDELELSSLKKEEEQSRVVAGMDGIVTDIKDRLWGSTCTQGEVIMRILDNSNCLFASTDLDYRDYFAENESVDMSITYGNGSGQYQLIPFEMQGWEDKMLFSIVSQPDTAIPEVGDIGSIELITGERTQVLCLPNEAVHLADGKEYVYVLNKDNVREVKWVETGLHGNSSIEITGNLAEGDKVILR